jgi:hypothetical protein
MKNSLLCNIFHSSSYFEDYQITENENWSIFIQGLNCQKLSGGLTSAYSLSLSLHTGDSASLTTAGVETDPQGIPGHLVCGGGGGVKQTTGGVQPPTPRQFKHCLYSLI